MILYHFNEFAFWTQLDFCDVPFLLVVIGFNQTTYSVREDAGSVTVNVSVMNGTISQDVIITLSTAPGGSATGGIIVLKSAAALIHKQELPYSSIKYHGYCFFTICFGTRFGQRIRNPLRLIDL